MKVIIIFLCTAVCMQMAVGLPGSPHRPHHEVLEQNKQLKPPKGEEVLEQQNKQLKPPKGEEVKDVEDVATEEDENPENGIVQAINAVVNNVHDASTPQVDEQTYGLRSTSCSKRLKIRIYNRKNKYVYLWWMNYSGQYVYYGAIRPHSCYVQRTYSTHPWVIADINGYFITTVIPYAQNMKVTIYNHASW